MFRPLLWIVLLAIPVGAGRAAEPAQKLPTSEQQKAVSPPSRAGSQHPPRIDAPRTRRSRRSWQSNWLPAYMTNEPPTSTRYPVGWWQAHFPRIAEVTTPQAIEFGCRQLLHRRTPRAEFAFSNYHLVTNDGVSSAKSPHPDKHPYVGTTALTLLVLTRSGYRLDEPRGAALLMSSVRYLVEQVEQFPETRLDWIPIARTLDGRPRDLDGSGGGLDFSRDSVLISASVVRCFAQLLGQLDADDPLRERVQDALQKGVERLQATQTPSGAWPNLYRSHWQPLHAVYCYSALEEAESAGARVNPEVFNRARKYVISGRLVPFDWHEGRLSAGVGMRAEKEVRSWNPTETRFIIHAPVLRVTARPAQVARDTIAEATRTGALPAKAAVTVENLTEAGLTPERAEELVTSYEAFGKHLRHLSCDDQGWPLKKNTPASDGAGGGLVFLAYWMFGESLNIGHCASRYAWHDLMWHELPRLRRYVGTRTRPGGGLPDVQINEECITWGANVANVHSLGPGTRCVNLSMALLCLASARDSLPYVEAP